jgi:hypothetical protein
MGNEEAWAKVQEQARKLGLERPTAEEQQKMLDLAFPRESAELRELEAQVRRLKVRSQPHPSRPLSDEVWGKPPPQLANMPKER